MDSVIPFVESILPITALCAIGLFVIKEGLEFIKKNRERGRKLDAYKFLLGEEIQKNAFTVSRLKEYFAFVLSEDFGELECKKHEDGYVSVMCRRPDGGGGGGALPIIHTSLFDKAIVELAVLDKKFLGAASEAYEAMAHVENCREQLLRFAADKDWVMLQGLSGYGQGVVSDANLQLEALYKFCTGKELRPKMRSFVK